MPSDVGTEYALARCVPDHVARCVHVCNSHAKSAESVIPKRYMMQVSCQLSEGVSVNEKQGLNENHSQCGTYSHSPSANRDANLNENASHNENDGANENHSQTQAGGSGRRGLGGEIANLYKKPTFGKNN